ncbi:unnamed protein product [Vicia faba]|uniref:ABC transporter domain-containing protein n=1 Tax=Vicia faba TaxID=3906 RepID=A0AAV1B250_VICFA|nr:unnamed protein product [Vicia faba]
MEGFAIVLVLWQKGICQHRVLFLVHCGLAAAIGAEGWSLKSARFGVWRDDFTCLQQLVHINDATAVLSLLQPAPETFELFDDLILMAEGKIVYHGPCSQAFQFFKDCGFWCPERKGVADFLQEVTSKKDQRQYCKYSLGKWDLFEACMKREILLMKRNSFIYIFKTVQLTITAIITMTVFLRTQLDVDLLGSNYLLGSLYYTLKAFYLYPAWAYCLPAAILKIPFSVLDSLVWTSITYYVIGYNPEITRFLLQFLLLIALHMSSTSMCRSLAAVFKTDVAATTVGSLVLVLMFLFGGFILPRPSLPKWLRWGFWLSPMSYGEIGITLNEFLAPRWKKIQEGNITVGREVLKSRGLDFDSNFFWISIAALLGFAVVFDILFVVALTYLKEPKQSRALVSKKRLPQLKGGERSNEVELKNKSVAVDITHTSKEAQSTGKMVLPFLPLSIAFKDVQYFVDTPPARNPYCFDESQWRRKDNTHGRYCEQNDIHSPYITFEESVRYSAWLRLPSEIDSATKGKFVEEVLETIELDDIKDNLVGIAGQSGLSTEQRKRLTIAVELVSNPSIIFMDEPTSGLDARATAVVMRAVKNAVGTGRTTVCTIHQPSIDIFETFDELILMKSGGKIIYNGMLGHHSNRLIEYFQSIPGVPKIKDNYNPATWMLEATSASVDEEVSTLRDEFQDKIDRLQNAFKIVIQQCNPQINIESIKDLLGLSHGDANSSPKDIRPQMHSSTSTHAPCHGKQCINEDVEKDDINDEIQEDDINDKIQDDDLNDKIQEDDVDDEFQEDDIDLDDEFQEEDIDGEFQEDDVDEEFMEDDISNEFQEDDLDALLLEDKLE